jgi:hypothetical protein
MRQSVTRSTQLIRVIHAKVIHQHFFIQTHFRLFSIQSFDCNAAAGTETTDVCYEYIGDCVQATVQHEVHCFEYSPTPVGPCGPVAPEGPGDPLGPVAPVDPELPVGPARPAITTYTRSAVMSYTAVVPTNSTHA